MNSDFKNGRVKDPYNISSKQAHSIKKYVKEFFDKAVVKHRQHEKKKREKDAKLRESKGTESNTPPGSPPASALALTQDDEVQLTDVEMSDEEDVSPNGMDKKRKRENGDGTHLDDGLDEDSSSKKAKTEDETPPPPPPPPPPMESPETEMVNGQHESPVDHPTANGIDSHEKGKQRELALDASSS